MSNGPRPDQEADMDESSGTSQGPAVDRTGAPVVDPTENVKDLNAAGFERQDTLRNIETDHVREILVLRTESAEKISRLEQKLIDEKFAGIERLAMEKESHRLELKADGSQALAAALSAADKAVDKAVTGMEKLIVNNALIAQAGIIALTDKLEVLSNTVGMLVNTKIGYTEQKQEAGAQRQEQRSISTGQVALISVSASVLFSIITIVITLLLRQ